MEQPKRNRADHLKDHRWPPGTSGNPGGRRKGRSWTARLRRAVEADDGQLLGKLVDAAIKHASEGNPKHMQMIVDRLDGPVATRVIVEAELDHMLDVARDVLPREHYEALLHALAATPRPE